ncbi:hypothetical protein [Halorarum salinum]|uniref:Uncharacterized protein n=1 Tax=Halorarum salinum TaxID=2743089 RepID=A0A7D5L9V9_9EURY|nr:hypothetical protein [Halobaculum salinum]QLG61149.1 hypothetical protein HUG12_05140 [Halobaculum salinum]
MSDTPTDVAVERVDFDAADPYADVEVANLPRWWRENLAEFEAHDLKTYLPSRFEDGPVVQRELERLEGEYGVEIRFAGYGVERGDDWTLLVDREPVATVGKRRVVAGYTVFELSSGEFDRRVAAAASGTGPLG